jgi:ribosomal protein L3
MSLSNSLGLLGRKVGMMRLFTDDGDAVPVTVVDVSNNRVTQIKSQETDGYVALQVTFGSRKASRVTKPRSRPPRQGGCRSWRNHPANSALPPKPQVSTRLAA